MGNSLALITRMEAIGDSKMIDTEKSVTQNKPTNLPLRVH